MKLNRLYFVSIGLLFCSVGLWITGTSAETPIAVDASNQIVQTQPLETEFLETQQLIVVFKENTTQTKHLNLLQRQRGFKRVKHFFGEKNINPKRADKRGHPIFDRMYVIEVDANDDVEQVKKELENKPEVSYVEFDVIYKIDIVPNDPSYSQLWGMDRINAPTAWDIATGSHSVIVAVIDTGTEYTHQDLAANIWNNPGEIPGNGIDDDGNGFIDDIHGWDFANNDSDPIDDNFHGTHTAGTIGAVGNNGIGVVGVNWNVSIMPMKFLDRRGSGSGSNAVKCMQYAINNGARVTSNSWGGGSHLQSLQDTITAGFDQGVLTVAAAGNNNSNITYYPAAYDHVFTVAAINEDSTKAGFSNFGPWVNITAPGVNILSTGLDDSYRGAGGTSMSCPHVAGVAALVLSVNPNLTSNQLQLVLETAVEDLGEPGWDEIFGTGVTDATGAVELASSDLSSIPELGINPLPSDVFEVFDVTGTVSGEGLVGYQLQIQHLNSSEWITVHDSITPVVDGVLGTITPHPSWSDGKFLVRIVFSRDDGAEFIVRARTLLKTTVIFSPPPYAELNIGESIDVVGMARGEQFQSYELAWGEGEHPTSWITFHTSTASIVNGVLGTFFVDIPEEINGYISIALRTFYDGGFSREYSYPFAVDHFMPGFPIEPPILSVFGFNDSIMVGNIQEEPLPVISTPYSWGPFVGLGLFAPLDDSIYYGLYDNAGLDFLGWVHIRNVGNFSPYCSSSSFADINNDGITEIIFTAFETTGLIAESGPQYARFRPILHVLEPDGTSLFSAILGEDPPGRDPGELVMSIPSRAEFRKPVPTIVDLNNDGQLDIVVGGDHTGSVHAINSQGEELPGFPIIISDAHSDARFGHQYWPHEILVADFDKNGTKEIVFFVGTNDGVFHLYKYNSDGTFNSILIESSVVQENRILQLSSPVPPIALDFDGDGSLELVAGLYNSLYAFDHFGQLLPGWPPSTAWYTGIAAGDVDGDGSPEIVAQGFGYLAVFKSDGTSPFGWPKSFLSFGETNPSRNNPYTNTKSNPLIADVDGDGDMDMLFKITVAVPFDELWDLADMKKITSLTKVYAFDVEGNVLDGFPKQINEPDQRFIQKGGLGSMAISDIDGNGTLDLLAGSTFTHARHPGNIKVWSLSGATSEWPLHRQNVFNTGGAPIDTSSSFCGDGVIDANEECDDGQDNSDTLANACRTTCFLPSCGDGVIDSGERCDDGNFVGGDGCDSICRNEYCGNGICDAGENKKTCSADCPARRLRRGKGVTECHDNIDNDKDGFCDYGGCKGGGRLLPPDPKCTSKKDKSESD